MLGFFIGIILVMVVCCGVGFFVVGVWVDDVFMVLDCLVFCFFWGVVMFKCRLSVLSK